MYFSDFLRPKGIHNGFSVFLTGVCLLLLSWTLSARAAAPEPILTITSGATLALRLSEAQLAAMPQHRIETSTPWTDGVQRFEGPLLRDVLALAGVSAATIGSVTAHALNSYQVDLGPDDFFTWDVILARTMGDAPLSRNLFGPLWIVYPRDQHKVLQDSRYDHRWAWQLNALRVNPKP